MRQPNEAPASSLENENGGPALESARLSWDGSDSQNGIRTGAFTSLPDGGTRWETIEAYHRIGWSLFPVHGIENDDCTCQRPDCPSPGKHPVTANGVKAATNDLDQLRQWFTVVYPWASVGMATGAVSGVDVVDVDNGLRKDGSTSWQTWQQELTDYGRDQSKALPDTLRSRTGGGGLHIFWRHVPGLTNRTGWLPHVDFRTTGGYVVLPPSDHVSGRRYEWQAGGSVVLAEMPPELVEAIRTGGKSDGRGERLPDAARILAGVPEGERDDTLFRWACQLRRTLNDDRGLITLLITQAAEASGFPRDQALVKVEQAFRQDHSDDANNVGPDEIRLTGGGNGTRFARMYGEQTVYVNGLGWHRWDGSIWTQAPDTYMEHLGKGVVEELYSLARADGLAAFEAKQMFGFARKTDNAAGISDMLRSARSDLGLVRDVSDLDVDPSMLTVANGTVDLRTGELLPISRFDLSTSRLAYPYDPSVPTPRWNAFLRRTMSGDEEMIAFLRRLGGYCFTGLHNEHFLALMLGNGRNGKNTFYEVITGLMGDLCMPAFPPAAITGKRADDQMTAMLLGKRLAVVNEMARAAKINPATVKSYTGDEFQTGKLLYKDRFTFRSTAKLWLISNHKPEILDNSDGMWDRVLFIPWDAYIPPPERIVGLKDLMLSEEAPGILAWFVAGARDYFERGDLGIPALVRQKAETFRQEEDHVGRFIEDQLILAGDQFMTREQLLIEYKSWCDSNEVEPADRHKIRALIQDIGTRTRIDPSYRESTASPRGIRGVGSRTPFSGFSY